MWEFCTEPEFQEKLNWIEEFVRAEVEPLDLLFPAGGDPYDVANKPARAILKPLQEQVKTRRLWACHLGPELGGQGYGQVKLALMNELLGRSYWAPVVFGTAAPDTGNAEILAAYGSADQKGRYLQPLLDGDLVSAFSMTEPHAGSDPKEFRCRAYPDGTDWIIHGEKWFTSNARYAEFLIVMAVTDPTAAPHQRMSMFVVPADTPGVRIERNAATAFDRTDLDEGTHAYVRYDSVRLPANAMLGGRGEGFKVAQTRLSGGRIHHAMRTVGKCRRAFDMMCERAVSRRTQGELLADKQLVQKFVADSWIQLEQFRLLVLNTAWRIDTQPPGSARTQVAMCKVAMAQVYEDIVRRALQVHGSLGTTSEMPLAAMWMDVPVMAIADGPSEVHLITVARRLLREYRPAEGLFPSEHHLPKLAAARRRYGHLLEEYA